MPRVHLYIKAAQIGPTAPQTGEATEALPNNQGTSGNSTAPGNWEHNLEVPGLACDSAITKQKIVT